MLAIEIDIFSGVPNPTFQSSPREEQELVDRMLAAPAQMAPAAESAQNFGRYVPAVSPEVLRRVGVVTADTVPGSTVGRSRKKPA